ATAQFQVDEADDPPAVLANPFDPSQDMIERIHPLLDEAPTLALEPRAVRLEKGVGDLLAQLDLSCGEQIDQGVIDEVSGELEAPVLGVELEVLGVPQEGQAVGPWCRN